MSKLTIKHLPSWQDVASVAANLRFEDRAEFYAFTGRTSEDFFISAAMASNPLVAFWDGEPAAVFGVTEVNQAVAQPWMMGTPVIQGFGPARALLKTGRRLFSAWSRTWPVLTNRAYAENHLHIRYIEALGCEIAPPEPFGPFNAPFREFLYVRTNRNGGRVVRH